MTTIVTRARQAARENGFTLVLWGKDPGTHEVRAQARAVRGTGLISWVSPNEIFGPEVAAELADLIASNALLAFRFAEGL